MDFSNKLKQLMSELSLSQTKLSALTGIGKSSISQYLSGKNEPSRERKKEIAKALGVDENYFEIFKDFEIFEADAVVTYDNGVNLPVKIAARLMHKSKSFIEQGLKDGVFPWGYAVKLKNWSYFISASKFSEYTGIKVPINSIESESVINE